VIDPSRLARNVSKQAKNALGMASFSDGIKELRVAGR
jgi:hypothetical protein